MELTLEDKRVITVDVSGLTVSEWRKFVSPSGTITDEDAVVTKCTGLTSDEIESLKQQDFRRIVKAIIKSSQEPLADPT